MKKRVAITGIGMVTPLGNNRETTWKALMAKQSGINLIKGFDASQFPCKIAAEVKNFDINQHIPKNKYLKYTSGFNQFGLAAAEEALQDCGIRPTPNTCKRWGLVAGVGMISMNFEYWNNFQKNYAPNGELNVEKLGLESLANFPPSEFCKSMYCNGLLVFAQLNNIQGSTLSVHTACASGGQALGTGLQAIRRGQADYIIAGGCDSMINPIGLSSFCLLGALSTYNDTPQTASRPFDMTRNGFVLGEGAAFLVLEDWEKAKARKAKIYAEFAGEGNTLSSYRITDSHPDGDGAIQAIENSLKDANLVADDIDYINAHGTGTKMNDLSETNAVKAVFKDKSRQIPLSSIKSQIGHLIAAAGAVEGAITALSLYHSKIPMTANLNQADPECDLDYVTEGPREKQIRAAMSNSFGFGGSNSSLTFLHPEFR